MEVAKSYENLERLSEPFVENDKGYIIVRLASGKEKKVRYYAEIDTTNYKIARGFHNGYILVVRGPAQSAENWCRGTKTIWYNKYCGWYCPSLYQEPPQLPEGSHYIRIEWSEVKDHINDAAFISNLIKRKDI